MRRGIDGALCAEIDVIEIVEAWCANEAEQFGADCICAFASNKGHRRGCRRLGAEVKRRLQRGIEKVVVDDLLCRQPAQIVVRQSEKRTMVRGQIKGGTTLGKKQAAEILASRSASA